MTYSLTHLMTDNLKARDASASKNLKKSPMHYPIIAYQAGPKGRSLIKFTLRVNIFFGLGKIV